MAKAKEKATYAIRAVERSCGLREGTLEDLGLVSVQSVLAQDEEAFLREYAERLGSEKSAGQVYRLALSAQERLLRLYKADRFGLADLANDSGKNYPYTDTPVGNRPNWVEQFPMLHPFAEPDDICNSNSPAAYLANLYWVATQIETIGGKNANERALLGGRRPDLAQLQINDTSVNQVVSKLSLVNEALQSYLSTTKAELLDGYTNGASTSLDNDTLLTRIYYPGPALPYHKPYDQVMSALTARKVGLGEILRVVDPSIPLWIVGSGKPRRSSVNALRFSSGLSPDRALLLTQAADFSTLDKREDWYQTNYGVDLPETFPDDPEEDLNNVATFADQTSQTPADVRRLLCVEGYGAKGSTVTLTKNIDSDVTGLVPDPAHYGATFICGGKSVFLTLAPETVKSGTGKTVSVGDKLVTSDGNTPDDNFFFRLNQVSRLRQWTGLAPDVLDLLLAAPMKAERASTWVMDGNTHRILGFYQWWSAAYGIDAEDAAALFAPLSPYAVGDGVSKFDRVFNALPGQMPIRIGSAASKFNYLDGSDGGIVGSLCAALKCTETELDQMGRMVTEGGQPSLSSDGYGILNRTLPVLSALYRIARVAACLKLSVADLFIFEARMADGYAGVTMADAQPTMAWDASTDMPKTFDDMEDLIDMAEFVGFVRAQGLTPAGLASLVPQKLALGFPVPAATPAHLAVLNNVATLLPNSLFELSTVGTLGLPAEDDSSSPKAIDWVAIVKSSNVVGLTGTDTAGLIAVETEDARQKAIQDQLASYTLDKDAQGALKYQALLDSFTAAQQRQYGVTDGVLGEALGLDMATVHNMLLAFVSNGSYGFLKTCQAVLRGAPSPGVADITPSLMPLLSRYTHNAMLVKHYALTPASLAGLANVAWFGLTAGKNGTSWWMHSLTCLYALNGYILWCQRAGNEDDVLQYLQNYNVDSPDVGKACTELARQLNLDTTTMQAYIDWVTQPAANTHGVLKDTTQMGRVLALMGLAEQSGLALNQIQALTALKPVQSVADVKDTTVDKEFVAWQAVAADLMATLNYTPLNEGIEA